MKFVFDLDGTICFRGEPVTETILSCLEEITSEGHEVIFASARPIRDMLPVLNERFHKYALIGGNGSLICKEGVTTHIECFAEEQTRRLLLLIEEHEATYLIDSEWDYAYTGPVNHSILSKVDTSQLAKRVAVESLNSIVKILILSANNMEELAGKLVDLGVVIHRHRDEDVIDVSPQGIHKWNALQQLGVEEKQYIAFGNDANDIPMFKEAMHSVMIGYHKDLAIHATETIALNGDYEQRIVEKVKELARGNKHLRNPSHQ